MPTIRDTAAAAPWARHRRSAAGRRVAGRPLAVAAGLVAGALGPSPTTAAALVDGRPDRGGRASSGAAPRGLRRHVSAALWFDFFLTRPLRALHHQPAGPTSRRRSAHAGRRRSSSPSSPRGAAGTGRAPARRARSSPSAAAASRAWSPTAPTRRESSPRSTAELVDLLDLRECRFDARRSRCRRSRGSSVDGEVVHVGHALAGRRDRHPGSARRRSPWRWRGRVVGRFVLTPTPGRPVVARATGRRRSPWSTCAAGVRDVRRPAARRRVTRRVARGESAGLPRARRPAWARPTGCSTRAGAARSAAPTWSSATSRPTTARSPWPSCATSRSSRASRASTAARRSRRWTSTRCWRASPGVALVDELAHTNVPGGRHEKRWQDVDELLEAGIDVITTVNIQHLEIGQRRGREDHRDHPAARRSPTPSCAAPSRSSSSTSPPRRCAGAWPTATSTPPTRSTRRCRTTSASGNLTRAARTGPAVAGRPGRGRAPALPRRTTPSRRRGRPANASIVGVTGTDADEALLRRAARIASRIGRRARSRSTWSTTDATRRSGGDTDAGARDWCASSRARFAGGRRRRRGDAPWWPSPAPSAAPRSSSGASRPRQPWRPPSGVVEKVLRHARDLDVHIIAVGGERPDHVHERRRVERVTVQRRVAGLAGAALLLPVLTAVADHGPVARLALHRGPRATCVVVLGATAWAGARGGDRRGASARRASRTTTSSSRCTPWQVARPDDVVALVAFLVFAVGRRRWWSAGSPSAPRWPSELAPRREILARAAALGRHQPRGPASRCSTRCARSSTRRAVALLARRGGGLVARRA